MEKSKSYTLEEFRERNIPKFGVLGKEYKLSINLEERPRHGSEKAPTYTHMLEMLQKVIQGEFRDIF